MSTDPIGLCDVWDLARRRGEVHGELPLHQLPRLAEVLIDDAGLLRYRLVGFIDDRGRSAATLQLDGAVRVRCDRCGSPLEVLIGERADFFFVADENELNRLPIDDAPDEPLLGSRRFDLLALVEEQAILALPISPRHDDCGLPASASDDVPPASDGETHRPFEALAKLKSPK